MPIISRFTKLLFFLHLDSGESGNRVSSFLRFQRSLWSPCWNRNYEELWGKKSPIFLPKTRPSTAEDVVVQKRLEYRQLLDEQNAKMVGPALEKGAVSWAIWATVVSTFPVYIIYYNILYDYIYIIHNYINVYVSIYIYIFIYILYVCIWESKGYELSLPYESRDAWRLWLIPTKNLGMKQLYSNQCTKTRIPARWQQANDPARGNQVELSRKLPFV